MSSPVPPPAPVPAERADCYYFTGAQARLTRCVHTLLDTARTLQAGGRFRFTVRQIMLAIAACEAAQLALSNLLRGHPLTGNSVPNRKVTKRKRLSRARRERISTSS